VGRETRSPIAALAILVLAVSCGGSGPTEWTGQEHLGVEPSTVDRSVVELAPPADPAASSSGLFEADRPALTTAAIEVAATPIVDVDHDPEPRATTPSLVARAVVSEIAAFRHPGGRHLASFTTPGPYGEPKVFLVREARGRWLRVLLPMRPNGVEGWIRRADVRLSRHRFAARVDLSERRLTAFRGSNVILRRSVAIGMPQSPTPTGPFYITVLARAPDPTGPYGPLALGLSGFSEVYTEFNGGNGQIAIHGTNAPDLIGQAASSGCLRMRNDDVVRLAHYLPLGTPVRIVP
jgi:lipoprotein-anchoring transpeptidase ErfK/SrfK